MESIYRKLKDPNLSTQLYSRKGGDKRAKKAINDIFDKISFSEYDLTKTKNVILYISSGYTELKIDEIGEIYAKIQEKINGTNILIFVQEKKISNDIEIHIILTSLEFDSEKIDVDKLFSTNIPTTQTLPLYFLEDEYSSKEISEMISFISDLYQDIGGDELIIRGFQSKLVKMNLKPTLY
jgi:hypothetical protein